MTEKTDVSDAAKDGLEVSVGGQHQRRGLALLQLGVMLSTLNFVLAVVVLRLWGDSWLDWSYQATLSCGLAVGYLVLLSLLQRFTGDVNRWQSIPLLLFVFYPWWIALRELL